MRPKKTDGNDPMLLTEKDVRNLVVMVLLSILCSVITIAAYHVYFSQRAIVMDIAGYIVSQKESYASGKISAGELVKNIDALVSRMNAAKGNRVYIFNGTAGFVAEEYPTAGTSDGDEEDREK